MERSAVARLGQVLCLAGAALGAAGLIGWAAGITWLTIVVPGQPAMMPNTALACLLAGLAGALRRDTGAAKAARALSLAATGVVLVIGIGTLVEYAAGTSLGLDELLRGGLPGPHPGRPSPLTALALTFLGFALLLFDVRPDSSNRPSDWFGVAAWIIAFTALLGQLFGTAELYRLPRAPVVGVAVPTAVSLFLLSAGLLLERPGSGWMRDATSDGPGGVVLRRLSLASILSPAVLGFLTIRLLPALGFREFALTIAILVALTTAVGLFFLGLVARRLNRSHEALEKLRVQTSTLFEQAADGIFVADLDGRYTDVNNAGCRMLGYTREDIIGMTILDLIPAGEVDRLWREKARMEQGSVVVTEWTLRKKDGSTLPVEISAKILPGGRWQGIVRDVSERKRLEQRLRVAEATSSGVISTSADAIILIDRDQRITLFNDGAEKIFGYTKAEMIGASLDTLVPERFRAAHRKHVEAFAAGPEMSRRMGDRGRPICGLRRDGGEFPADAAISRIEVGGRSVLTVALRDITELKQIQDDQRFLAEAGLIFATTLDYEDTLSRIAEAVVRYRADFCIVDIVGRHGELRRLRVASRDPAKQWISDLFMRVRLSGYRSPMAQSAVETARPVLLERIGPGMLESLATSEEHLRALRAAGPRSMVVVPLLAHGEPLGAITLISATPDGFGQRDLHLAEDMARRATLSIENARLYQEARSAIRARDEMMGVVAHDLRNPLHTIVMQSSLLRENAARSDGGSRKGAEIIKRAAGRMERLIRDLLDVTRIEAGRLPLERTAVSAAQLVAEAVQAQAPQAGEAGIELRSECDGGLPDVWADHDRLLQVFENLIGNALKFTPANGRITVGGTRRGGEVVFRVSDTGKGIAAADIPRLFDRFWQAGDGDEGGAGLGLSIVRGIVQGHEGRVWAESETGAGSTFFFTIPTAERAGTGGRPGPADAAEGRASPPVGLAAQRAGSAGHVRGLAGA
jgi:PAS domain S-box-containing protein